MPLSGWKANRHVLVPRPSWCVFRNRSFVGWNPNLKLACQKPGVLSCNSHVLPGASCPPVLHMMFFGSEKPARLLLDPEVMVAVERLITWPSRCVGTLALPSPVNEP